MSRCMIQLTCPACETPIGLKIELTHAEIHPDWPKLNRLIYTCPACQKDQRHDLQPHQWEWLNRNSWGELRQIALPRGLISRFAPNLPGLTEDDVIEFGRQLQAWPSADT